MSRIGKQPITVPSGVDVTIDGAHVRGEGPEGPARATTLVGGVVGRRATATTLVVDARRRLAQRTARCTASSAR